MTLATGAVGALQDVTVGLNGGALVGGLLRMRGSSRIVDLLTNSDERSLVVERADTQTILVRDQLVWIASEAQPKPHERRLADNDLYEMYDHTVRLLAGPFEITGRVRAYRDVEWSDYLLARSVGGFFVLEHAEITGLSGPFAGRYVNINASRVAALTAVSSRPATDD